MTELDPMERLHEHCRNHPRDFDGSLEFICSLQVGSILKVRVVASGGGYKWKRYRIFMVVWPSNIGNEDKLPRIWLDLMDDKKDTVVEKGYGFFRPFDLHESYISGKCIVERPKHLLTTRGMKGLGL